VTRPLPDRAISVEATKSTQPYAGNSPTPGELRRRSARTGARPVDR
jgi:hypothetical protein